MSDEGIVDLGGVGKNWSISMSDNISIDDEATKLQMVLIMLKDGNPMQQKEAMYFLMEKCVIKRKAKEPLDFSAALEVKTKPIQMFSSPISNEVHEGKMLNINFDAALEKAWQARIPYVSTPMAYAEINFKVGFRACYEWMKGGNA